MSVATEYTWDNIYGKDGERFRRLLDPIINNYLLASFFSSRKERDFLSGITEQSLHQLEITVFFARLAARDHVPVNQEFIDNLRKIFISLDDMTLDNPVLLELDPSIRNRMEELATDLAITIPILDIENNPKVRAIFKEESFDANN